MKNLVIKILSILALTSADVALAQMTQTQRAELRDTNLLGKYNPGFENGKQSWSASGGTFSTTSSALDGVTSATWTPSGSSQNLDSTAISLPAGAQGANCQASILYKGSDANTTFEVFDVTTSGIVGSASLVLTALTTPGFASIPFVCPASADSIKLRLTSTAASAQITFDKAFLGIVGQAAVVTVSPVVYSQPKSTITALGSAGFNPAGHVLTTTEWPFTVSGKLAFYNLSSSATTDNSGALSCSSAACTLTNNSSVAITATNIFGTTSAAASFNGTTQSLSSTAAFFNPGNGKSFAYGGWFSLTNWAPGSGNVLMGNIGSGADLGFEVYATTNGGTGAIRVTGTNTAGSNDLTMNYSESFAANSWHHVVVTYDQANTLLTLYVDGKFGVSGTLANQRTVTTSTFRIGADSATPAGFMSGSAEDLFFYSSGSSTLGFTADDARKLYSKTISHNLNTPAASQRWTGNWYRSDSNIANQLTSSWVVHKDPNTLYADFSDIATGAAVDYSMETFGQTATSARFTGYDSGYLSATPGTTIAHGLGSVPDNCWVKFQDNVGATPAYEDRACGDWCSEDSTNLYCDWTGLTVDGTHQVRITAWLGDAKSVVPAAGASTNGLVNTSAQTFGGDKTFNGSVTRSGEDAIYVFNAAGNNPLSSATLSPVVFATTFVDQTSAFSSNTYTCKHAGIYRVAFDGSLNKTSGTSTAGDFWNINIRKNGAAINSAELQMSMGYTTGQDIPFHTEVLVSLAVNDTVTAAIVYNAGGARTWVGTADNVNLVVTKI